MTTTTKAIESRTYHVSLNSKVSYPLNWDHITEHFSTLEAAMAKAEEWIKRYPKGIATRTRYVDVESDLGTRWVGSGSSARLVVVGRKVHLDTRKAAK